MKSYIVYIIRSGATKEETEGKYIGHTDVELSEEGRKQLENMRSELVYPPVGAVISSPLKRCTDTAAILYPDNKCITIDSLIECNFGEFEGKDAEELKDYPMFPRWLAGEQGVEHLLPLVGKQAHARKARLRLAQLGHGDHFHRAGDLLRAVHAADARADLMQICQGAFLLSASGGDGAS